MHPSTFKTKPHPSGGLAYFGFSAVGQTALLGQFAIFAPSKKAVTRVWDEIMTVPIDPKKIQKVEIHKPT
jgi:hypothetical protein